MKQFSYLLYLLFAGGCSAQTPPPTTPNGRMFYVAASPDSPATDWRLTVMFGVSADTIPIAFLIFQSPLYTLDAFVPYETDPDFPYQHRLNWDAATVTEPRGTAGSDFPGIVRVHGLFGMFTSASEPWVLTWTPEIGSLIVNVLTRSLRALTEVPNPAMQGHHSIGSWIAMACSLPAVFHW